MTDSYYVSTTVNQQCTKLNVTISKELNVIFFLILNLTTTLQLITIAFQTTNFTLTFQIQASTHVL